ncbi:MAG: hypothetical protein HY874_07650 [Chloroflexi bacterium]|nr:hypothetical protein [Chloroflexota bacterium]
MLAGLWSRALDGYAWDNDVALSAFDGPAVRRPPMTRAEKAGPWLRPANTASDALYRIYPVLKERKILDEFVALSRNVTPAAIQRFAGRWGLLGRSRRVVDRAGDWEYAVDAEPLSLWEGECLSFRMLWDTWEAVRTIKFAESHSSPDLRAAHALLRARVRWSAKSVSYHAEHEDRWMTSSLIASADYRTELWQAFAHDEVVEPARYYVHETLNERLRGHVDLSVLPTTIEAEDGHMRFSPRDLLSAIYVHFALDLAGGRGLERACASCQQRFLARRRDQQFCDKNCRERAGYHRRKEGGRNGRQTRER